MQPLLLYRRSRDLQISEVVEALYTISPGEREERGGKEEREEREEREDMCVCAPPPLARSRAECQRQP